MTITPFGRRVHIRPKEQSTVIQTSDRNLAERGTVLAVGDKVENLKVGDKVLFTSFGVDSTDIDGTRNYFLIEDDSFILGTYVDDE